MERSAPKEKPENKELKVRLAPMEKTEPTDFPDLMERKENKVIKENKEIKANKGFKEMKETKVKPAIRGQLVQLEMMPYPE